MRPQPFRGDERAFEVRAEHMWRRAVDGYFGERPDELILGRRDEGRLVGRHTALEERAARAAITLRICREEVDPGETVHLEVDEPGRRNAVSVRRSDPDGRVPPAGTPAVAGKEGAAPPSPPDPGAHAFPRHSGDGG